MREQIVVESWDSYFEHALGEHPEFHQEIVEELRRCLKHEQARLTGFDGDCSDRNARLCRYTDVLMERGRQKYREFLALRHAQDEVARIAADRVKPVAEEKKAAPKDEADEPRSLVLPSVHADISDLSAVEHEELISRLTVVACEYRDNKDYPAVRERYLALSRELNCRRLQAPVFRDQPRVSPKPSEQKKNPALLVDQILIDLHWLKCRGEQVRSKWPMLTAVFVDGGLFDWDDLSKRLAVRSWSTEFRANELLVLANRQQVQLIQLREDRLKNNYRELENGKRRGGAGSKREPSKLATIGRAINNWSSHTHQIRGHEEMYEALWLARELLGDQASYNDIAQLAALRCGVKPLSSKSTSTKLTQLDAYLIRAGVGIAGIVPGGV